MSVCALSPFLFLSFVLVRVLVLVRHSVCVSELIFSFCYKPAYSVCTYTLSTHP